MQLFDISLNRNKKDCGLRSVENLIDSIKSAVLRQIKIVQGFEDLGRTFLRTILSGVPSAALLKSVIMRCFLG